VAHHSLTGVLLVGGASTRFGSPKALAELDGRTLAEIVWERLGEACDERIAVGKRTDELRLPFELVDDGTELRAPIAGVVAGLRAATSDCCVLVPVDCAWLSADSIRLLGERVAVPQTGPLPGAYTKAMLPELDRRMHANELSLRGVNDNVVDLPPAELRDADVPGDLDH
jgi:molybdopterin-guanine dinucleotide biosynthesis protein A